MIGKVIRMYINHVLIDKYLLPRRAISSPTMIGGVLFTGMIIKDYYDHKDLRTKERGRCDAELTRFGKCLEENPQLIGFDYKPCEEFLEAYKRCLRGES